MLLAVLSGLLLSLCFPKPDFSWLAWVSLIPLFIALSDAPRPSVSFLRGYVSGFTFFLILLYWIYPTCRAGGVNPFVSLIATVSLCAFLALLFGIFGLSLHRLSHLSSTLWPLAAASLWITLELFRERVMGFPWELLGYSQWRHPMLLQITSLTGVHGLSFLIVWFNAAIHLSLSILLSPKGRGEGEGLRKILIPPAVALILVLLFGHLSIKPNNQSPITPLKFSVLQGNIDQYKKWDAAFVAEIKSVYRELTTEAAKSDSDLLIWPESAIPGWLEEADLARWLSDLVKSTGKSALVGVVTRDALGVYNSALLVGPDGLLGPRYAKRHLVPFGEYVPLQNFLGKWVPVLNELGGITGGTDASPLPVYRGGAGGGVVKLGSSVCYEIVFPDEVRRAVKSGAEVLVNLTNDGWYLDTAGPYQHLSMNALRAAETHRPLIRAANTGISALFDPHGRLVASLPIGHRGILRSMVSPESNLTFFSRYGEVFAWLCVAATASLLPFMGGGAGRRVP